MRMFERLNFVGNVRECFSLRNLRWHVLAMVLTYAIVMSGFDWYYYVRAQKLGLGNYLFPAAILGGLLPMILPLVLFFIGIVIRNRRTINTALAVAEAALIGLLISSFYKAFTGRIQPPYHSQSLVDISHQFQFGFLRHGIFWGWPSSHTTVAFAVAVTLFILYRSNVWIRYGALTVAFYIGIGISVNIHWFSEFVAGAIFGSVIGIVVGRCFLDRQEDFSLHNE